VTLQVRVDAELQFLLAPQRRGRPVPVPLDPTATLGHVVESLGVPLTEVGALLLDGEPVGSSRRADRAAELAVHPVRRPQTAPTEPPRFLLDVHLGSLARRLRLLGLDAGYRNDTDDDELVRWAGAEQRVLLTQDRGLLRRRAVGQGAFVRGAGVEQQTRDVLDRFAPRLAPWTRCSVCGGVLRLVDRVDVEHLLQPGTRRSYAEFAQCTGCGRPYWRGAHSRRLEAAVARAQQVVAARRSGRAAKPCG
jgi:uncharacterized protein with PIN domain